MKVIALPTIDVRNIPRGLRALADAIEAGKHGEVHFFAWAMDVGGDIEVGALGGSAEPGAVAHLIFGMAQRRLERL